MLTILQWETEWSWSSFSEQVAGQVEERNVKQVEYTARVQVAGQIWGRTQICVAPVRSQIQNALRELR